MGQGKWENFSGFSFHRGFWWKCPPPPNAPASYWYNTENLEKNKGLRKPVMLTVVSGTLRSISSSSDGTFGTFAYVYNVRFNRKTLPRPSLTHLFGTAVPFWGQNTQIISSSLSPKRDCGSKGVNPYQCTSSLPPSPLPAAGGRIPRFAKTKRHQTN